MRRVLPWSLLVLAPCAAVLAAEPPPKRFGRDRLVDIEHARIELSVDIPSESVEGATELTFSGIADDTRRLEVDAVRFDLRGVTVDGRAAEHDYDGDVLRVTLEPPLAAGERRVLRVEYSARPRNGLYFVHGARRDGDQCWSQGETEENRHWFPVHDDPAERMTSETIVTVAAPLQVVGNGPLLAVTDAEPGRRTFHHRMDFPHVPYLVSIAVGDWETRRDEWEGIELTYHAPKPLAERMDRTFATTPRILDFISRDTGVKYPYPVYRQVAVSEYIHGGMENIAATTLNDQTLHDERAHSDWTSDSLVAHEAAHQWFGDYVTCRDWNDVWLNEGFATYYAALSLGELLGPDQLVHEIDGLRSSAIAADAGDKRRPVVTDRWHDVSELFDGHAYAKGAMILHALRRELGDEAFRRSVNAWLNRHAGRSAGTAELLAVVEDVTGRDVSRFFDQWLYGAGHPELELSWTWRDGDCAITVTQSQDGEPFDVPLDLLVLGEAAAIDKEVRLSRKEQTFHVACEARPKAVLLDPQGHLLRSLEVERKDAETAWALRHAPHLLARMEAARDLKESAGLPEPLQALTAVARDASAPWVLRKEAAAALELAGPDATAALLAVLDGDADSRVRAAAAGALARHREDRVRAALIAALGGDDSYAVRAAAARSLGEFPEESAARALETAVEQRSHREEVLAGALDGLAERRSPKLRAIAERLAAPSQPYAVRQRAIAALGRVAKDALEAPERQAVRERLVELLDDRLYRVRVAAAEALVTAGDPGPLSDLRRVAASHPHELTRARVKARVAELEKQSAAGATVADLRRALDDERRKREELEERVRKLERRQPPTTADAGSPSGE